MTTEDFIIALFFRTQDVNGDISKHHQANLYPSGEARMVTPPRRNDPGENIRS